MYDGYVDLLSRELPKGSEPFDAIEIFTAKAAGARVRIRPSVPTAVIRQYPKAAYLSQSRLPNTCHSGLLDTCHSGLLDIIG